MVAHAFDVDLQAALDLVIRLRHKGLQPNVLLLCPAGGGAPAAERLAAIASAKVHSCTLPGHLALPASSDGTLVLHDVAALTRNQQTAFLDWLNIRRGRVQVISISEAPLDALVRAGGFDAGLYYRLNTIRVP